MANALVIHKDRFPQSQRRYSRGTIRPHVHRISAILYRKPGCGNRCLRTQLHNLSIVRTYRDEGESGLTIKSRMGLGRFVDDVRSGNADFGTISSSLTSAVGDGFRTLMRARTTSSFANKRGIKVAYCAEQFQNDGSLISQIIKNIKRVMAAEYSRELSAKVYAGQSRSREASVQNGRQEWPMA